MRNSQSGTDKYQKFKDRFGMFVILLCIFGLSISFIDISNVILAGIICIILAILCFVIWLIFYNGRWGRLLGITAMALLIAGLIIMFLSKGWGGIMDRGLYNLSLACLALGTVCSIIALATHIRRSWDSSANLIVGSILFGVLTAISGYLLVSGIAAAYPAYEIGERYQREIDKHTHELTASMKSAQEIFALDDYNFKLERGIESTHYLGIANTDDGTRCFRVALLCINSLDGLGCDANGAGNQLVGGEIPSSLRARYPMPTLENPWFKIFTFGEINATDTRSYPYTVQVGNVVRTKYTMEAIVFKSSTDCSQVGIWEEYARKEFYLKLT
ncbi:MAG: hypothetical protein ABIF10_01640 [Candidatus Woesearchaeota archaeon]